MSKPTEKQLVNDLKTLLSDKAGENFAKPLSEFWKGCTREQCPIVGCKGVWFSADGGSIMKDTDGEYPCDYYTGYKHPEFQKFLDKYENYVYLTWYDPGTPLIMFF